MEPKDYQEPQCPFDASAYTGTPDAEHGVQAVPVPRLIRQLDELHGRGRDEEAGRFLETWREKAEELGDWRAELSLLSEMMGHYRRTGEAEKGLAAVEDGLALIRLHRLGTTVSGATVMLNAATTMKCFGQAARSIPFFEHAARVYADTLDPGDYRFAGLYNNMALSYQDVGELDQAERHFRLALQIIGRCPNPENELAVTWCNLAELYYRRDPEDERASACMEQAWQALNAPGLKQDGYHAFTISKCVPSFDFFGFFLYAKELRERAARIYEGT